MTEEQIERKVERMIDHLDHLLLSGAISQKDYDITVKDLNIWATSKLAERK
jgi:hypothetical protein